MRSRHHPGSRTFSRKASGYRKAVSEPLCSGKNVRRRARSLIGKEISDPANPGLHLVEDQEGACAIANLTNLSEDFRSQPADATFP